MLLNKNSSSVAIGGISGALSIVFLIISSVLPACKLAFVFLSSVIVGMLICVRGNKLAIIHYISVSILSLLFLPNKIIAVFYTVVIGNYPIVKRYLERLENRAVRYLVKIVSYNVYMLICYIFGVFLMNIDFSAGYSLWILWLIAICAFAFYDYIYMPFVYKAYDLINKI